MLYRVLLPMLLLASATTPAPQDVTNSDITYVQVKPLSDSNQPEATQSTDDIPLSILENNKSSEEKPVEKSQEVDVSVIKPDTFNNNRSEINPKNNRTEGPKNADSNHSVDDQSETIQTESDIEHSGSELAETQATDDTQIDSYPSDTILSDRRTNIDYTSANYDSGETTETAEALTERYDVESETRKYPSSRSFPKLSHKRKANGFSFTSNLIDKPEKRKFKSTCKCMKIWNCPKLQISVGRCAEEYFLCCF